MYLLTYLLYKIIIFNLFKSSSDDYEELYNKRISLQVTIFDA